MNVQHEQIYKRRLSPVEEEKTEAYNVPDTLEDDTYEDFDLSEIHIMKYVYKNDIINDAFKNDMQFT